MKDNKELEIPYTNSRAMPQGISQEKDKPRPGDAPTPYEYAVMSELVIYNDNKIINLKNEIGIDQSELTTRGWKLLDQTYDKDTGYSGAAWINYTTHQVVVAHKGKDFLETLFDIKKIAFDEVRSILEKEGRSAINFTKAVIKKLEQGIKVSNAFPDFTLSFTGHALGGYYAVWAARYFFDVYQAGAVVFDAPGTKSLEETTQTNLQDKTYQFDFSELSIVNYLSPINIINTCNEYYGRIIQIFPKTLNSERNYITRNLFYHLDQINMTAMRREFDPKTGEPTLEREMLKWPLIKWGELNAITTGAARSPVVEIIFGISVGPGALIGLIIGILEDLRNNTLAFSRTRIQTSTANEFLDYANNYQPRGNLSADDEYKLEILGNYKEKEKSDNEEEIFARELHPDVRKFLWDFYCYPLKARDYTFITEEVVKCLSCYFFLNKKNKKLIINSKDITIKHFIKTISRFVFDYIKNTGLEFAALKNDMTKWRGAKLSSYVLDLEDFIKQLDGERDGRKNIQFEFSINDALKNRYRKLKIKRAFGNEVDLSTYYIPNGSIEKMTFENTKNRKLILGDPGSGKSTLCKFVAQAVSEGKLLEGKYDLVFLIALRNINLEKYGPNPTISQIIFYECFGGEMSNNDWEILWREKFLNKTRILYILDGYDENKELNETNEPPSWFINLLENDNVILTARSHPPITLDNTWEEHEIPGFSKTDISRYLDNYFGNNAIVQNLKAFIEKNEGIECLIEIPLHLEIICGIWEKYKGNITQLSFLYEEFIELLLRMYLVRVPTSDIGQVRLLLTEEVFKHGEPILHLLKKIAYDSWNQKSNNISSPNLTRIQDSPVNHITRQSLLKAHFVNCKNNINSNENDAKYYFINSAVQKYLAALYLSEKLLNNDDFAKETIRQERNNNEFTLILIFIAGSLRKNGSSAEKEPKKEVARKLFFDLISDEYRIPISVELLTLIMRCLNEMSNPEDLEGIRQENESQLNILKTSETPSIRLTASFAEIEYNIQKTDAERAQELATVFIEAFQQSSESLEIAIERLQALGYTQLFHEVAIQLKNMLATNLSESDPKLLLSTTFKVMIQFQNEQNLLIDALRHLSYSTLAKELASTYLAHKENISSDLNRRLINRWVSVLKESKFDNAIKAFNFLGAVVQNEDEIAEALIILMNILKNSDIKSSAEDFQIEPSDGFVRIITNQFVNNKKILLEIGDCSLLFHLLACSGMTNGISALIKNLIVLAYENENNEKIIKSLVYIASKYKAAEFASVFCLNMRENSEMMDVFARLIKLLPKTIITILASNDDFLNLVFNQPIQESSLKYASSAYFEIFVFCAIYFARGALSEKIVQIIDDKIKKDLTKNNYIINNSLKEIILSRSESRRKLFSIVIKLMIANNQILNNFSYSLFWIIKNIHNESPEYLLLKIAKQLKDGVDKKILDSLQLNEFFQISGVNMPRTISTQKNKSAMNILCENTKDFICYVYIAKSLSDARRRLVAMDKNVSLYVFLNDKLYYIRSQDHDPVEMKLDSETVIKIRDNLRNTMRGDPAVDIEISPGQLNKNQLKELSNSIFHVHPDSILEQDRSSLYEALLSKGKWHESYNNDRAVIEADVGIEINIITSEINILFKILEHVLGKYFLNVHETLDSVKQMINLDIDTEVINQENYEEGLIKYHYARLKYYNNLKQALNAVILSKMKSVTSVASAQEPNLAQQDNLFEGAVQSSFNGTSLDNEIRRGEERQALENELRTNLTQEMKRIKRLFFIYKNRCRNNGQFNTFSAKIDNVATQLISVTNIIPAFQLRNMLGFPQVNSHVADPLNQTTEIAEFSKIGNIKIFIWKKPDSNIDTLVLDNIFMPDDNHYPAEEIHILRDSQSDSYFILLRPSQAQNIKNILIDDANLKKAEEKVNKRMGALSRAVNGKAINANYYSEFIIYILDEIESLCHIGEHVLKRKNNVIELRKYQLDALESEFDETIGSRVLSLPFVIRKELYMKDGYPESDFYKIECMRDLQNAMLENNCIFFAWPIEHVQYFIDYLMSNKMLEKEVRFLISALSNYFNSTLYNWESYCKLHDLKTENDLAMTIEIWGNLFSQMLKKYRDQIIDALICHFDIKSIFHKKGIDEIQIYFDQNKQNMSSNITHFIDELFKYYSYVTCFHEDFTEQHNMTLEVWHKELKIFMERNDIYKLLIEKFNGRFDRQSDAYDSELFDSCNRKCQRMMTNISELRKKGDRPLFFSFKKALYQLLKGKTSTAGMARIEDSGYRLENIFTNAALLDEQSINELMLNYVYESLYHIDILQSTEAGSYQYILRLHVLLTVIKSRFCHSTADTFINIFVNRINVKLAANKTLSLCDVASIVYDCGNKQSFNFGSLADFERSIFNHHLSIMIQKFHMSSDSAKRDLYVAVKLLQNKIAQNINYYLPSSISEIDVQDKLMEKIEGIRQAQDTPLEDKSAKFTHALERLYLINAKLAELIFMLNLPENFIKIPSGSVLNRLYDIIIIPLLNALPTEHAAYAVKLVEEYMQVVIPKINLFKEAAFQISNRTHAADMISFLKDEYFNTPLNELVNFRDFDSALHPIIARHIILDNLINKLRKLNKSGQINFNNYTDEFLNFLCSLLDVAWLALDAEKPERNFSSLFGLNQLIDKLDIFFRSHFFGSAKISSIYTLLNKLRDSLGLTNDALTKAVIGNINSRSNEQGWVSINLSSDEGNAVSQNMIGNRERLLKLMREFNWNQHPILLKIVLNEGVLVSDEDTKAYIASSPQMQALTDVCLYPHAEVVDEKSLLHYAIQSNCVELARWLIVARITTHHVRMDDRQHIECEYFSKMLNAEKTKLMIRYFLENNCWNKDTRLVVLQRIKAALAEAPEDEEKVKLIITGFPALRFAEDVKSDINSAHKYAIEKSKAVIRDKYLHMRNAILLIISKLGASDPRIQDLFHTIKEGVERYEAQTKKWYERILDLFRNSVTLESRMEFIKEVEQGAIDALIDGDVSDYILWLKENLERIENGQKWLMRSRTVTFLSSAVTQGLALIKRPESTTEVLPQQAQQQTQQQVQQIQQQAQQQVQQAQQQVHQAQQQAQQAQEAQQQAQQQAEEEKKKGLRLAFYNTLSEDFDIKRMKQEVSLFEAASSAYKQVNHNEGKSAAALKEEVVAHIRRNRERFARSVLDIDKYISDLESGAIDGDYLSLQALSEVLGRPIVVLRPSFNESNPVEIKIIGHQVGFEFDKAMLVIFDGQGHYDVSRVRGNQVFAGMVCEKAQLEIKSATKIQAMFRGYIVRKEQRVDGEPKQDASVGMSFAQ